MLHRFGWRLKAGVFKVFEQMTTVLGVNALVDTLVSERCRFLHLVIIQTEYILAVLLQKVWHGHDLELLRKVTVVQVKHFQKGPFITLLLSRQEIEWLLGWQNQCPPRGSRHDNNHFERHADIVPTSHVDLKTHEFLTILMIGRIGCHKLAIPKSLWMIPIDEVVDIDVT